MPVSRRSGTLRRDRGRSGGGRLSDEGGGDGQDVSRRHVDESHRSGWKLPRRAGDRRRRGPAGETDASAPAVPIRIGGRLRGTLTGGMLVSARGRRDGVRVAAVGRRGDVRLGAVRLAPVVRAGRIVQPGAREHDLRAEAAQEGEGTYASWSAIHVGVTLEGPPDSDRSIHARAGLSRPDGSSPPGRGAAAGSPGPGRRLG